METEMHANNRGVNVKKDRGNENSKSEIGLRVLALLLTLTAAILMGVNKQTKMVSVTISPDLPPFVVPATAKYRYLSAFVYFVVINSLASIFAAISLFLALTGKRGSSLIARILIDLIMVALLFSCIGSAGAVGVLGFNGNSHLMWKKVCNVYSKFCHQTMAAIALSLVGGILFVLLVFLNALKLKRISSI